MTTQYYTFEMSGQNLGYHMITQEADRIEQNTRFRMGDDEIHNIFVLKLDEGQISAFKYKDDDWVQMNEFGENCYPSSAYELLLELVDPVFEYESIEEGSASVVGTRKLVRDGHVVTEFDGGDVTRRFWLKDGQVVQVDWGGAISKICGSFEEAVAGSSYET